VGGRLPDDHLLRPVSYLLESTFGGGDLPAIRQRLEAVARVCGLTSDRAGDWVIAVNELMANAIRHGDGRGELRVWRDDDLYCEVRDRGPGFDAGPYSQPRNRPAPSANGGMGLWIAQQMSEALHIDSGPSGTVVLLRSSLAV
jgi:serine/threonine-protein kinase RsbW